MIIAQISDPHISTTTPTSPNTAALERAVAHLLAQPALPDVVIVTGDCTDHGSAAEYALVQELLAPLPMPFYVIPGNHDSRERLLASFGTQGSSALPGFVQYVVDDWPVRLIALDTHVPGQDGGLLDAARLDWLAERLAEAPERPTLVFMHHPPFPSGMRVMDTIGLEGAAELAALLGRHPQVELLAAGHVHGLTQRRWAGTLAITCPATTTQLLPDFSQPERLVVRMDSPACLLHVWQPQIGMVTYDSPIGDARALVELHDGTRWVG